MAASTEISQLVEVRNELEQSMDSNPVTDSRRQVFRNVAGHWALSDDADVWLPDNLDVPGVLTYSGLDNLVYPDPKDNASMVYRGYVGELVSAASPVLGPLDPGSELGVLTKGTIHAIEYEASQRLGGYVDIIQALGKSDKQRLELMEVILDEQDRNTNNLREAMSSLEPSPEDALNKLYGKAMFITHILINFERRATQDVIADRPVTAGVIKLPEIPTSGWRGKLFAIFGGV